MRNLRFGKTNAVLLIVGVIVIVVVAPITYLLLIQDTQSEARAKLLTVLVVIFGEILVSLGFIQWEHGNVNLKALEKQRNQSLHVEPIDSPVGDSRLAFYDPYELNAKIRANWVVVLAFGLGALTFAIPLVAVDRRGTGIAIGIIIFISWMGWDGVRALHGQMQARKRELEKRTGPAELCVTGYDDRTDYMVKVSSLEIAVTLSKYQVFERLAIEGKPIRILFWRWGDESQAKAVHSIRLLARS